MCKYMTQASRQISNHVELWLDGQKEGEHKGQKGRRPSQQDFGYVCI